MKLKKSGTAVANNPASPVRLHRERSRQNKKRSKKMNGLIKTSPTGDVASVGLLAVAFVSAVFALVMLSAGVIA
jgi:hypothetical protein